MVVKQIPSLKSAAPILADSKDVPALIREWILGSNYLWVGIFLSLHPTNYLSKPNKTADTLIAFTYL